MRIYVKSVPEFWEKEKNETKSNIVRKLDGFDTIEIENTKTKETIIKKITDISIFDEKIMFSFMKGDHEE